MGFVLTLNTNATLITEEIARLFKQYPPRFIKVTLYGGSNDTYQSLCHTSQGWDRCIAGLKLLKQYGIATKLTLTLIEKNRQDYHRMMEIAHELELPTMLNAYTSMYTRKSCASCIPMADLRMSPEEAARLEIDYQKDTKGEDFENYKLEMAHFLKQSLTSVPDGLSLTCRAGKSSCWINWQGIMTPCVDMDEPSASVNDLPVAEAWQHIVQECQELPFHLECKGCTLKQVCDVCYANATNEKQKNGNLDYLCRMAKAKEKLYLQYPHALHHRPHHPIHPRTDSNGNTGQYPEIHHGGKGNRYTLYVPYRQGTPYLEEGWEPIFERPDIQVFRSGELEARKLAVGTMEAAYAIYKETNEKEIEVYFLEAMKQELVIDTIFVSCLALERHFAKKGAHILHCCFLHYHGQAILFSGPSGIGKSTHANLWCQHIEDTHVVNETDA